LIATGFGWFLTTLAESDDSLLYSIGRVASWLVELELVYLVLSFPTGHLPERIDRVLVGAMTVLVAGLYLPTALITEENGKLKLHLARSAWWRTPRPQKGDISRLRFHASEQAIPHAGYPSCQSVS
jgi:hypothetical protein